MQKIQYLRVIVTEKCNLKCFYCHGEGIEKNNSKTFCYEDLKSCLEILCDSGIKKIKFMGGEPTLYPDLARIILWLKRKDFNLDISMITNGIADIKVLDKCIEAGIDRINVSMHGFREKEFYDVTRGNGIQLCQFINNIKYLKSRKKLGKVNYVLLKNINEKEFEEVLDFICKEDIVLDVLNYIGDNEEELFKYGYTFDEIKSIISAKKQIGNVSEYINAYSLNSQRLSLIGGGEINLKINRLNDSQFLNACKECKKKKFCTEGISAIRLTNEGIIKPCLFRKDMTYDLLANIRCNSIDMVLNDVREYLDNL